MNSRSGGLAIVGEHRTPHAISFLPVLVVHAHTSCNCRCVMCDIWKTTEGKSFTLAAIEPHLDSIRRLGVRTIAFSGGEPLLNPRLPEICSLLRKDKIHLTLLTTGLLLKKCANDVAASFDDVIVSLDGPQHVHDEIRQVKGGFALIAEGIAALRKLDPEMPVTARCTVQRANHHSLCDAAVAARSAGFDSISFLAADLASTAFNRPLTWPAEKRSEVGLALLELGVLEAEIEKLIELFPRVDGHSFVTESPEKLRAIARHSRAELGLTAHASPKCNAPWVSAVIETDGSVRPCFFHPPIGNLKDGELETVLNSERAREFRAGLDVETNPICNRCVCSLNYRG